jgi:hypothetical protein
MRTPVKLVPSALAASLLALQAGCPLLDISAEVPEVCITYSDFEVDGSVASRDVSESFTFDDLSAFRRLAELDAGVAFTRAEVRVKDGIDSLSFVEAFSASIASGDPDSPLPTLVLFDCAGDCAAAGASLSVKAADAEDALAYVQSSSLVIGVAFTGEIPRTRFTLDVDVCMKARVGYRFEP